ncbi:MAG: DUF3137 domain-containing protein [Tannerella sp.]|jgi:hypothetical protein|nr:DUF3137 domain-containing protein [Tannerella sp.]
MSENIAQLQQELYATLKKAERNRRRLRFFRTLCYGGAVIYFLGMIVMQFFAYSGETSFFYTLNPNPSFWEQYRMLIIIIPLFILITAGSYGLGIFYSKYIAAEQDAVRRIIRKMFPDARCALFTSSSGFPMSMVQRSHFFGGIDSYHASALSFGTVSFENSNRKMTFHDIVINRWKSKNRIVQTSVGNFMLMMKFLFRGVTSKRVENITSDFRGMFAETQLEKSISGTVVVLPDHLESRLDYLAKNIQALKSVDGNKLVHLEDVEFERYFAVYSSDEITARYVLTPAMMLRITELKRKYNRDIMLSFSGDRFYFAVAMPEGFLTLSDASPASSEALKDLYDNIAAARDIAGNLKLK